MTRYAELLERFRDELDSLNVYPVPDGDTGTNLLQTARAVVRALGAEPGRGGDAVARTIVRASLMGARGNSGVILSQTLRGLCDGLADDGTGGEAAAAALRSAADASRRAVDRPREGTVLTVLDDAAAAAAEAARRGDDAASVLADALTAARASLARTVDELPELHEAGVVDAGGKGAVLLLDALHAEVAGEEPTERPGPRGPAGVHGRAGAAPAAPGPPAAGASAPELEFAWEVQALVEAPAGEVPGLRGSLSQLGESLAVVGGDGLFNVHVHTDRPDDAVASIRAAGTPVELSVLSLAEQVAACGAGSGTARAVQAGLPACAMVAVAAGPGLADAFRSLGASVVGAGERLPSAGDLRGAVGHAAGQSILLLPNDEGLLDVATEACAGAPKPAAVIAASSAVAGLAAATAFHPDASPEENATAMRAAANRVRSGSAPADPRELLSVAERLRASVPGAELVTVVAGADVTPADAAAAADGLRAALAGLEVQLVLGGQPGPAYVLGME